MNEDFRLLRKWQNFAFAQRVNLMYMPLAATDAFDFVSRSRGLPWLLGVAEKLELEIRHACE